MPLHHLMLKLDLIRLRITGNFRECAEDIIDRYDTQPMTSESDIELAGQIVELADKGVI